MGLGGGWVGTMTCSAATPRCPGASLPMACVCLFAILLSVCPFVINHYTTIERVNFTREISSPQAHKCHQEKIFFCHASVQQCLLWVHTLPTIISQAAAAGDENDENIPLYII